LDEIGRFLPDEQGRLYYQSFISNLPSEQRSLEIWSTSNQTWCGFYQLNQQVYFLNGSTTAGYGQIYRA